MNFENVIAFETEGMITLEEEQEISDLVKQVLRRRKEDRKVRLFTGLEIVGKEL